MFSDNLRFSVLSHMGHSMPFAYITIHRQKRAAALPARRAPASILVRLSRSCAGPGGAPGLHELRSFLREDAGGVRGRAFTEHFSLFMAPRLTCAHRLSPWRQSWALKDQVMT